MVDVSLQVFPQFEKGGFQKAPHARGLVCIALAALLCAVVVTFAFAQVAAGDRIRVTRMGDVFVVGYLGSADAAKLILRTTDSDMKFDIPFSQVTKVEVSRGEKRQTVKGAMVGGGIGLLIGVFVAGVFSESGDPSNEDLVHAAARFTLVGLAIGGIIGAVNTAEKWERVELDELTAAGR